MVSKLRIFLLGILLLTACQAVPATPAPTASPALTATPTRLPVTATALPQSTFNLTEKDLQGIEIQIWHAWFDAPAALLNRQITDFNKENAWGIHVSADYQGSYNMLFNAVTDSLDSEKRPQIVLALVDQISVWDELDSVKNLTPYITDPVWGYTTAETTDFPDPFLAQDQRAERQIALPAQRTARFLLYNRTWAEELGFISPPHSFDDFSTQACAANQAKRTDGDPQNDGKGGWIIDNDPDTVLAWMLGFGGSPFDENGTYQFISSPNINSFKELKNLYDQRCIWLSTADTPYQQFAERSALFISAGMEEFPEISRAFAAAGNQDEWTALPYPGNERSALITYGTSYALLETDDEAEALAAWLFIKWMLTPEHQAQFTKSTALFPIRISSLEDLSDYEKDHPQWSDAVDLISQAEIQPTQASWHRVRYLLGDGFESVFRFNLQAGSVAATLAEMNKTAKELSEQTP
jgi:multiple sugar transport system substrate-binding protein